jgi:glycosyltransferase involved in cell wall biosynthesis
MRTLKVAIIASARFPIREPFAGGLESHTWSLAQALTARGHTVTVFAAPGSDPALGVEYLPVSGMTLSAAARADVSMCPDQWLAEHHAYLQLMLDLMDHPHRFDVVHNNSLHYLPIAMAPAVHPPMVTTLHTPPTPWLESALQLNSRCPITFASVSRHTAQAWRHLVPDAHVIYNGVDLDRWPPGPGGGPRLWSGRIVPEKGTHLAIEAARLAGQSLEVVGPIADRAYFDRQVRPLLDGQVRYLGHLTQDQLAPRVGAASAVLVTPCWDEPYGLVVVEALASGTPVAGFDAGAIAELIDHECGQVVPAGNAAALAEVLPEVMRLDRAKVRDRAVRHWSRRRMVDHYVRLYQDVTS